MGRGRGGRGRGRGHSRSGSGFSRGSRNAPVMSRRDKAHLSQFGEVHPSQELERDFGPSTSAKRGKFERGRGRGRGFGNKFQSSESRQEQFASSDSDSSEIEEETTPYNELLSVFTGKVHDKKVQIISDEEEDSSVDSSEEDGGGVDKSDSAVDDDDLSEEEQSVSDSDDADEGENSSEEGQSEVAVEKEPTNSVVGESGENQAIDEEAADAGESMVIEDAELDPELNDIEDEASKQDADPFVLHFEREMSEEQQAEVKKDKSSLRTLQLEWHTVEKFTFVGLPDIFEDNAEVLCKSNTLSDLNKLPKIRIPDPPSAPLRNHSLETLHIKSQMHSTIPLVNQASIDKEGTSQPLTRLQSELLDLASRYHDIYFPLRTISTAEEIRLAYCLHAANHVLKIRTRILHHNAKMANKAEVPDAFRDQGFVRPKVLILAPFKDTAFRIVKILISLILTEEKGNVANKKRFVDEYGGETLFMPKTNPKPEDYVATFSGNTDDNFKIGMAVTKKSIKLYTGFYSSDIIVASPLGLRMIIGAEGEKGRDYDFLSSIEVLIMDQADVFLMQNWDHILHLMRHLHLQPLTTHGTDFARIRPWALDGLSAFYRQTLIFSSVACPEHLSLMTKYCKNFAGQARIIPTNVRGTIRHVTVQLPQVFQRFDASSIQDADDARFTYFTKNVLPNFKEKLMSHTLIFIASYFDFVRLRNYFRKEEVSFVQICEYTKDKKIARARDLFFHGSNHFMLYTERSHYFRRFRLKGVGHIIFYQLPQNPQFYPEICNLVQENFQNRRVRQRKNSSVNVVYCKYDTPRLAAIVGTERAGIMLNSEKNIHAFVSGDL